MKKIPNWLLHTLIFFAQIGFVVMNSIQYIRVKEIRYEVLLGILSMFMISCGMMNLLGDVPYTIHLLIVGFVGLFLSLIRIIYLFLSIGITLLFAKKENT